MIPHRASGYTGTGSDAQEAGPFSATALMAAGGIYSTGADVARWMIGLHSGRVLRPDSYAEMTTADAEGFGYGLNVSTQYGLKDIGHVGDVPGFHASTEYFPARKTGIVVLTNVVSGRSTPGTYAIANDLMQLASDSKAVVRSTGRETSLSRSLLEGYVGQYTDPTGQQIEISRVGDHLSLVPRLPGKSPSTLRAETANRFYLAEWDGEVQFDRDRDGSLKMIIFAYPNETATIWVRHP